MTSRMSLVFNKIKHFNGISNRLNLVRTSYSTSKIKEDAEEDNSPIKYMSSGARNWQAKASRMGKEDTRLWYEPFVIIASIGVFMIYFTVLREENDVDKELNRSLYTRIAGLEEQQLKMALKYNQEHNLDTEAIKNRLKELDAAKNT